jgi:type II secretory pathway component GspD/PulD (secretin)
LDTSLAETTVLAKEGSTIIIGGLRKEEVIEKDRQTPGLSSIPLLGNLFKSRDHTKQTSELLIILTPRIISGDSLVTRVGLGDMGSQDIKSLKEYAPNAQQQRVRALPSEAFVNLEGQTMSLKGPR